MLKTLKSNHGFTLLETVVAVAITAILFTVLLPAFLNIGRIYRDVTGANLLHARSVHAIEFIKTSVYNASELKIITGTEPPEGYSMLLCKDKKLYYKMSGKGLEPYMPDADFDLSFTGDGRLLGINLSVITDGEPFTLNSAVALQNVASISGGVGSAIIFKTIPDTR